MTLPVLVSDLNVSGDTLVLILVVLAIILVVCAIVYFRPWRNRP